MTDKSPRTIATINFKGGVGITTVPWCLGDVLSSMSNQRVLRFDLDAQMAYPCGSGKGGSALSFSALPLLVPVSKLVPTKYSLTYGK